jgi:hypothetical protein
VHEIICKLNETPYRNRTLNLRAAISYSRAERARVPQRQRENNQLSHDQAMQLANAGMGPLKEFERTHRRIERLIEKLEANPKKKDKAPQYRKDLDQLRLVKLFTRVNYGDPKLLSNTDFMKIRQLLRDGDLARAQEENVAIELINCAGKVVDGKKLKGDAEKLEASVRSAVGLDNIWVDIPPGDAVKDTLKIIDDIFKKKPVP